MLRCDSSIAVGKSRFIVIYSPIEMKPLHPAVKYSLVGIISVILFAPVVKNFTKEDPMVKQSREASERIDKFLAETDKKDSAQKSR